MLTMIGPYGHDGAIMTLRGFVEHYIVPVIYPGGLTPQVQVALGTIVLVLNLCLYGFLIRQMLRGS